MVFFSVVLITVVLATTWLQFYWNDLVPGPYMDEIFHIPQAQAYCNGSFHIWDPKITTLPGLYLVSAAALGPLQLFLGDNFGCSVLNLRFINLGFNWLNLILLYKIISNSSKNESEGNKIISTLSLGLSPLLFFYSFLYYTDPASTFSVLLMHYTYVKRMYVVSPLIGIIAVMMRQTNIVWLIWYGCNIVWESGEDLFLKLLQPIQETKMKIRAPKKNKKNQQNKQVDKQKQQQLRNIPQALSRLNFEELSAIRVRLQKKVIPKTYMYAVVFLLFVLFLIINQGIVVGDKAAHTASINIPQVFYFSVFSMTMGFPAIAFGAPETLKLILTNRIKFVLAIILGLIIVHFNTTAHPYLLADNRHYTFYLWKRLYETRPILKYLLVPAYVAFGFFVSANFNLHPSLIFTFLTIVSINLIPQKLLEFRYFLLPYIMLRLHMKPSPTFVVATELIWALILNWFTIRKFLYEPFKWPDSTDDQRFMW